MMLLCDMQELEEMMTVTRRRPEFMALLCANSYPFLKSWVKYRQWGLGASTMSMPDDVGISMMQKHEAPLMVMAQERDRNMCPFTKNADRVEVAQIFPSFLISEESAAPDSSFWIMLSALWGRGKVSKWHEAMTKMSCANFISMDCDVHDWFANNVFALRPLEYNHSKTELEVEWYWQPFHARLDPPGYVNLTDQPFSSSQEAGSCDTKGHWCEISLGKRFVKSGHKFVLRTSDLDGHPLPSRDLLELQWYLNRQAAMSCPQAGRTFSNTTDCSSGLGFSGDEDGVQVMVQEVESSSSSS